MSKFLQLSLVLVAAAALTVGCGSTPPTPVVRDPSGLEAPVGPTAEGARYLLAEAPADPKGVLDVREKSKDGEDIVIVGKIGGDKKRTMVDNQAAFLIVDLSLKSCDEIPGDDCETPWDYCCAEGLNKAKVLVRLVDERGDTPKQDVRRLLGLKELQTVVIKGKVKRDEGSVVVLASALHVRKPK